MTIIYWLLGVLLITNLIIIIVLFDLKKEYKDNREVNKLIVELWKNNDSQMDKIFSIHDDIYEQYKNILESYKLLQNIHGKIYEEYKTLEGQYTNINSDNAKLIEYAQNIEDRYSDCYEQYLTINDKFDKILMKLQSTE